MSINIEYQKIGCIQKMDCQFNKKFQEIVNVYAPKLSDRVILDDAAYTLHDFNHHCIDIYKIISDVLLDPELAYKEDYGLTQKELFILNLAVLFHDIGMFNALSVSRKNHSLRSSDYLQDEFQNSSSTFRIQSELSNNEFKALKAIIIAHSDVKDGTVLSSENGLNSPHLINQTAMGVGIIRTKFLAGILRLADELDVSSDRIGNGDIVQQIINGKMKLEKIKRLPDSPENTIEIEKWKGYVKSLEHWNRLQYISSVRKEKRQIILVVDDEHIQIGLNESKTIDSMADELVDIQRKIEKELKEALEKSFVETKEKNVVPMESVSLCTQNHDLDSKLHDLLSIMQLTEHKESPLLVESEDINAIKKTDLASGEILPSVLDEQLEKEIIEAVNNRKLVKFGHFRLNNKYCARDWINTKEFAETRVIFDKIVDAIVKHINTSKIENYIILGIDLVGSLLASKIAFALQTPFSYIIPAKEEDNSAKKDIEVEIGGFDKIVLIADAIVTYDTILTAINNYGLSERLSCIYTMFYRRSDFDSEAEEPLISKTFSTNNSFDIELFERNKCQYKNHMCIAYNRKLD